MHDQSLPTAIPISTAAILAGLSPATFRARCLNTGLVELEDRKVLLWSLAAYLGHAIEVDDFLAADRRRDPARRAQRDYRRNHQ